MSDDEIKIAYYNIQIVKELTEIAEELKKEKLVVQINYQNQNCIIKFDSTENIPSKNFIYGINVPGLGKLKDEFIKQLIEKIEHQITLIKKANQDL